jgi:hypothetical protein
MSTTFDPTKYLVKLRGKGGVSDYLEVKYRILWFRTEHPDGIIDTECIHMDETRSFFKATVSIPGGGSATGWKQETAADFRDHPEKAETGALGRALAQLGYGTQFVGFELDENTRIVDSPVEGRTPPAFTQPRPVPAPEPVALTDEQEKVIAQAWEMAEAHDTYPAIIALIRTLRAAATPQQWAAIKEVGARIQRKHYASAPAERPASYAG